MASSPFSTQGVTQETVYTHFKGREPTLYGRDNRFEGVSTMRDTYRQWDTPPPPAPREAQMPGPSAPFDGTSTYKTDFPTHALEQRIVPPPREAGPQLPFDGCSTYAEVFKPWELEARQPPAPRPMAETLPFEGISQYKDTFRAFELPERPPPPIQQTGPQLPFDGTSSYRDSFPAHAIPAPPAPRAPPPPMESAPFDGTTTHKSDFVPHEIKAMVPPPARQFMPSDAKFDGNTTNMDTYKAWEIPERGNIMKAPPIKPSLPFDGTTTHRESFKGWRLSARRSGLGVAMFGDLYFNLIPADSKIPCRVSQVFTTSHDNQDTICILVLEGDASRASMNKVMGQFDLTGLPLAPRGVAQVEVTFTIDENSILTAEAEDLDTGRQADWHANGGAMVAHVDESRMDTLGYVRASSPA